MLLAPWQGPPPTAVYALTASRKPALTTGMHCHTLIRAPCSPSHGTVPPVKFDKPLLNSVLSFDHAQPRK